MMMMMMIQHTQAREELAIENNHLPEMSRIYTRDRIKKKIDK